MCYGCVSWTLTQATEQMICTFEREILRTVYGSIQDKRRWRHRWNSEIYILYKDLNIIGDIKLRG